MHTPDFVDLKRHSGGPERPMTGSPLAKSELTRVKRYRDEQVALFFIDLDRFKAVNDSLDHRFGDLVPIEVAEALQGCLRGADTIARVGGDELVVMPEGVEIAGAAEDARARIGEALDAVRAGLPPGIPVGASRGGRAHVRDQGGARRTAGRRRALGARPGPGAQVPQKVWRTTSPGSGGCASCACSGWSS